METCTDDNIFAITPFLLPLDLANFALVCKRFGEQNNDTSAKLANKRQRGWPWSMMEEASRRRVSLAKDDKDNLWRDSDLISIRGEESWMAVDHRLYLLKSSYVFRRIIGSAISHVDGDITHVQLRRREKVGFSVAICQEVMKAGKHYAEFTITEPGKIFMGIIRPIHDWRKKKIRHEEFGAYCRNQSESGPSYVGNVHQYYYYDDRHSLKKGDVIGMLLDLNKGNMAVYKNGACLGVKMGRGLTGHYSWAVTINNYGSNKPSVRIGKGLTPGG